MRTRTGLGLAALATLFALPALAMSRIAIPDECDVTTFHVTVTADGKPGQAQKLYAGQMRKGDQLTRQFQLAHDGKRICYYNLAGFALAKDNDEPKPYRQSSKFKTIRWAPDSKRFQFVGITGDVNVADADAQAPAGGPLKSETFFKATKEREAFSTGWGPNGSLYLLEQVKDAQGKVAATAFSKASGGGSATVLVELKVTENPVWYFAVPQGFEYGTGPSEGSFKIVLGAQDGLYLMGGEGGAREKMCDITPTGLQDILLTPDSKTLLIRFGADGKSPDGKTVYKGVILGHVDKWAKGKPLPIETLYDKNDAHTLWFSTKGKYATWCSKDTVGFREIAGKPGSEVLVNVPEKGQITGCYWDSTENRLAIAAANKIYVYDVAKKALAVAADVTAPSAKAFVADPVWRGDDIVFTQFVPVETKK